MLEEASDLDADTFPKTSQKLHERIRDTSTADTNVIISIRESVRKPVPKGGSSVSVNVSVEVQHLAEQMAKELGLDAEQLIADAEKIAASAWEKR